MINSVYNSAATIVQSSAFRWTAAAVVGIPVALYAIAWVGSCWIERKDGILDVAIATDKRMLAKMAIAAGAKMPKDQCEVYVREAVEKRDLDRILFLRLLPESDNIIQDMEEDVEGFVKTAKYFFGKNTSSGLDRFCRRNPKESKKSIYLAYLLDLAIVYKNQKVANFCLQEGINLNKKIFDITPLARAAHCNHLEMVRFLIAKGAESNFGSPLAAALKAQNYEIAEYLVDKGAYPEELNPNGLEQYSYLLTSSPASLAALLNPLVSEDPCPRIFKVIHHFLEKESAPKVGEGRYYQILYEIFRKNVIFEQEKKALDFRAIYSQSCDWMEKEKWTTEDRYRWIEKLLSFGGVTINTWDSQVRTSGINWALKHKKFDLASFFWNKGARCHLLNGIDSVEGLDEWIDFDAILARKVSHRLSEVIGGRYPEIDYMFDMAKAIAQVALPQIVRIKHKKIIPVLKKLLRIGADPNLDAVLHYAAQYNTRGCIYTLIEAGADPNLRDHLENTPLHLAAKSEKLNNVGALLNAGANPDLQNAEGETPLHLAAIAERETPLHLAAQRRAEGVYNTMQALLDAGADPTILDNDGRDYLINQLRV